MLISNVYDLYYPPRFEDQRIKTVFYEKSKIANFEWEAPANKDLKAYAVKHYEKKHALMKEVLFLIFFLLVSVTHILILRRVKRGE